MNSLDTRDPLNGITLKTILVRLHEIYGWEDLALKININCFRKDPSISSSLKFLRKTPWARQKVEQLYIQSTNESVQVWKKSKT